MLRFITCGSVDDGKSTLIGRMLFESKQILDDQMASLISESKKYGTQGENIDYALLVDGLSAEREQGITIDVAYRFFSTSKRKFIVADTPGHEQYTRNMVTGASTADLAVILVDASQGILTQTCRHALITSLMGIKHIVLAINKMDLVHFDFNTYRDIKEDFQTFAKKLKFETILPIPLSALKGDNVFNKSVRMSWYAGPSLIEYLESLELNTTQNDKFIFPVQWVNRPDSNFRGFSGSIVSGKVEVGHEIRVVSSGQTAKVAKIVTMDGNLKIAENDKAITLVLDKEIDASRGDVITSSQNPLELSDHFKATIVWMHQDQGLVGRQYDIKLASQWSSVSLTEIKYRLNTNTMAHEPVNHLDLNDIAVCTLHTSKLLAYNDYESSKSLGGFILIDRFTNATVAAGMIHHSLRRGQNIHKHKLSLTHRDRALLNGHRGKVIWFTGLSGSGKSTIANALELELYNLGKHTYILDGDNIRHGLNKDLGFTDIDRVENIRRIAEVAKLMCDAGLMVITAFISPFKHEREMAKTMIDKENFVEVYIDTPLDVCEKRDPKGLYRKARKGIIPNMTGIDSAYEIPHGADITLQTNEKTSVKENMQVLMRKLKAHLLN